MRKKKDIARWESEKLERRRDGMEKAFPKVSTLFFFLFLETVGPERYIIVLNNSILLTSPNASLTCVQLLLLLLHQLLHSFLFTDALRPLSERRWPSEQRWTFFVSLWRGRWGWWRRRWWRWGKNMIVCAGGGGLRLAEKRFLPKFFLCAHKETTRVSNLQKQKQKQKQKMQKQNKK